MPPQYQRPSNPFRRSGDFWSAVQHHGTLVIPDRPSPPSLSGDNMIYVSTGRHLPREVPWFSQLSFFTHGVSGAPMPSDPIPLVSQPDRTPNASWPK